SDAELEQFVRGKAETIYHPAGTCRMGKDAAAVVDPQLRVRGIDGLRVVDASVMPELPGGNTNAPVTMIAERTADLLRGRAACGQCSTPHTVRGSSASATLTWPSCETASTRASTSTCLAGGANASSGSQTSSSACTPCAGGA